MIEEIKRLDTVLKEYVRPMTFPLAVKFLKDAPLPPKARRPLDVAGHPLNLCQGIALARRYGWVVGFGREDHGCAPSLVFLGFETMPDVMKEGSLAHPFYAKTLAAGARTEGAADVMERGGAGNIVIAPLHKTDFVPDVILIYGNPGQVVRLIQGANYAEGGGIETRFCGRTACASELVTPYIRQKYNVTIPGGGEKVFGQTNDDEMAFSFPFAKTEELIEGLQETHESGIARIPVPIAGLRVKPTFPPKYQEIEKLFGIKKET